MPGERDRALLQTLVFGVLRWRGRIDFVIATFSRTPLNKIQPDILNILRMALFQVMFLDRIPVSAAVNTAVELAKPLAPVWVVRFVNALLRKAAAGYQKVQFPVLEQNPVAALAALKSFPMQNSGVVVALDVNTAKLKMLMAEMKRLGISIVRPYRVDLSSGRLSVNHGPYDRILLDAPCSGLGVLRRNPDAKWSVKETALGGCGRRQVEFLNRLALQVNPGRCVWSMRSAAAVNPKKAKRWLPHL